MDLALLFFLPLLGGYFFVRQFLLTRYRVAHDETARVYYLAALAGCALALVACVVHEVLVRSSADYVALARDLQAKIVTPLIEKPEVAASAPALQPQRRAAELRSTTALICIWALLLGLTAPLWNRLISASLWLGYQTLTYVAARIGWRPRGPRISPIERLNRRAITDDLEKLLYEAMVFVDLVQLTLDNSKVYVGFVRTIDPVGPAKHLTLQPLMSGGRDAGSRDVVYTSYYDRLMRELQGTQGPRREELARRFRLVVPLARVVCASGFDMQAFRSFELARRDTKPRFRLDLSGQRILVSTPRK